MYLTYRSALVRNLAVATVNGAITLMILLIAPLGLAAVIANTILIAGATFFTGTFADTAIRYLQPGRSRGVNVAGDYPLGDRNIDDIERR